MKKIIVCIVFLLFHFLSGAQVPSSFYLDEDDQYASCRFTQDYIYFYVNGKMVKTDYQGNVIWTHSTLLSPYLVVDENIYGVIYSGNNHIELAKADSSGNIIWAKDLSQTVCPQYPGDLNGIDGLTVNGNRIYISSSQWNSFTGDDGWAAMMMLDTSGNLLNSWCDPYSWMSVNYLMGTGFQSITGGGWYLINHPGVGYEQSVVKVNSNGTFDLTHPAVYLDMGWTLQTEDIITLPDSNYLALCNTYPDGVYPLTDYHIGLSKFDDAGNVFWQKLLRASSDTAFTAYAAAADSNGNIYIDGEYFTGVLSGKYLIKLDSQGNLVAMNQWTDSLFVTNLNPGSLFYKNGFVCAYVNYFNGAKHVPGMMVFDTSLATCGISQVPFSVTSVNDTPLHQSWLSFPSIVYSIANDTLSSTFVADPIINDLCIVLSGRTNAEMIQPEIFPNPFITTIHLTQNENEKIRIIVFDLAGEKLIDREVETNEIELDLSNYPQGVYQLCIVSKIKTVTKKLVKIN